MNTEPNSEHASVKAEITVVFNTGNLMDEAELLEKYNGNIEEAVTELISKYSLFELVEKKYSINKINLIDR
jgi:hypothetical protein